MASEVAKKLLVALLVAAALAVLVLTILAVYGTVDFLESYKGGT